MQEEVKQFWKGLGVREVPLKGCFFDILYCYQRAMQIRPFDDDHREGRGDGLSPL